MKRTRIKVCGITRIQDGVAAAELGVDAIGLVFYPPSARFIDADRAAGIVRALPPFVTTVGLFLGAPESEVRRLLDAVPLDMLQFHGLENAAYCGSFGRPYIKSMPMGDRLDWVEFVAGYPEASGFLLDSNVAGEAGGSGASFEWSRIPTGLGRPLILAGGLTAENVESAVTQVAPYGVDVSTGVERTKGIKDPERIRAFIRGVIRGDTS